MSVLNLIIQLDGGAISGYIWDTGCLGCESSSTSVCLNSASFSWKDGANTFTKSDSYCAVNACSDSNLSLCDLKLFVSWVGTDSNNKYMESAAYRISNFKQQNIEQIYQSMANMTSPTKPPAATLSAEAAAAINSAL